ncbi:hypothetical protein FH972_025526 [Carpinus fangiana]|uniref:Uncharacterized protein n=1 Tax=Carpinus fangiana TaxID=176857 RepID=A0A5N6L3V6_9ROSI|nr:hypothetical protein FH972_025526 [Carpinus fangiana]
MVRIYTPRRCLIELQTLRATGRWGERWKHSSSKRGRRNEPAAQGTAEDSDTFARQTDKKSFQRIDDNPSLPLPPFLRKRQQKNASPFERSIANQNVKVMGTYPEGNKKTLREKLKEAPFATRMRQNPYAYMLSESVREERFSLQRLPRSCLLRFNVIEDEEIPDHTAQSIASTTAPRINLALLPLDVFDEAMPKGRNPTKLTPAESQAREALGDGQQIGPRGSSTYLLARHDMLAWVSADARARVQRVLSGRTRDTLDKTSSRSKPRPLTWQPEMPQLVLAALRKATRRLLTFLLRQKGKIAERPGLVAEVPGGRTGGTGLRMLDRVADVLCVIRMGHSARPEECPAARREQGLPVDTGVEEAWQTEAKTHLHDLRPLSPVVEDVDARFPTLWYRNRRVPLYDLPQLLGGQEAVRTLVAGTSFVDSEWVTLSSNLGSLQLLQLLFRLHAYLAYGQEEQKGNRRTQ